MTTKETRRGRGRPRTVDRERAVDSVMMLWWRDGLRARSLNQLCREAGLSKPALYREFGGEDGWMTAALERYREVVLAPLLQALAADQPFGELLDSVLVYMTSERETPAGCLFTRMRLEPDHLGPLALEATRAIEAERLEAFASWYRRGLEAGEANPSLSPELAARYLDGQLTLVLAQLTAGADSLQQREQARLACRALLR